MSHMPEAEPNFNAMLEATRGLDLSSFSVRSRSGRFAEFPADEYKLRYAKACKLMEQEGLDAIIVSQAENVRYFSGYLTLLWCSKFRSEVVLLPRDPSLGPTLIIPAQETGNALGTTWIEDMVIYPDQDSGVPFMADAIKDKLGDKARVGAELGFGQRIGMTVNDLESLRSAISPGQIVSGTSVIQAVRMVKSPAEVARLREACRISQVAARTGFSALRPGMTEKELGSVFGQTFYAEGAELGTQPSFFTISTFPERNQMVNSLASDYAIREGDMIMIDGGANYGGYATDFIRQAVVGDPTDDQRRWFEVAQEACQACVEAIRPGIEGAAVYEAGMDVFRREGLFEYNVLNIVGHGVGMELHELPWLGEAGVVYTSTTVLEPGMVVCVEPVIAGMDGPEWKAGAFIVEQKVAVTESGGDLLTDSLPTDLWVQPVGVTA